MPVNSSLVPVQGCRRWPVLRPARRESVRRRQPSLRLPSVPGLSLREPTGEHAGSEYPASAEDPNAARWRAEHPRPLFRTSRQRCTGGPMVGCSTRPNRRSGARWVTLFTQLSLPAQSEPSGYARTSRGLLRRRAGRPTSPQPRRRTIRSPPRVSANRRMWAASLPSPMRSMTRSLISA